MQRICEGLVQSTHALLDTRAAADDAFGEALGKAQRLLAHDALLVLILGFSRDVGGRRGAAAAHAGTTTCCSPGSPTRSSRSCRTWAPCQ